GTWRRVRVRGYKAFACGAVAEVPRVRDRLRSTGVDRCFVGPGYAGVDLIRPGGRQDRYRVERRRDVEAQAQRRVADDVVAAVASVHAVELLVAEDAEDVGFEEDADSTVDCEVETHAEHGR